MWFPITGAVHWSCAAQGLGCMEDDVSVLRELGKGWARERTVGGSKRSHSCQVWSLCVVELGKRSPGAASHSLGVRCWSLGWAGNCSKNRSGNFSKHCSYEERNFSGHFALVRFLKQSSHESSQMWIFRIQHLQLAVELETKHHYFQRSR